MHCLPGPKELVYRVQKWTKSSQSVPCIQIVWNAALRDNTPLEQALSVRPREMYASYSTQCHILNIKTGLPVFCLKYSNEIILEPALPSWVLHHRMKLRQFQCDECEAREQNICSSFHAFSTVCLTRFVILISWKQCRGLKHWLWAKEIA